MYRYLISVLLIVSASSTLYAPDRDQSAKINIGMPIGPVEVSKQLPIAINNKIALGLVLTIPALYYMYPYLKFAMTSYEQRYKKAQKFLSHMQQKYEHCKYWQEASSHFMKKMEEDRYWIKKYADGLHKEKYEHVLLAADLHELDAMIAKHQKRLLKQHPELGKHSVWDNFNFPIQFKMPKIQVRI